MATDHPITPETIAREAAETAVDLQATALGWYRVGVGPSLATEAVRYRDGADKVRGDTVTYLARAVLAAIDRALCEVPVPGGLSAERLAEIRREGRRRVGTGMDDDRTDVEALLDHVAHLTRALHDCGQDGSAKVWAAGYEAGAALTERLLREAWLAGFGVGASLQKGIDVAAADAEAERWHEPGAGLADPNGAAWNVRQAVRAAMQATAPPEG